MLHRNIEKQIMDWIHHDKRALLVYGVRQAGKTFIIRECLKCAGCDYVEFNLIEEPKVTRILQDAESTDDLITKLSLYSKKRITPGQTILFFDEIQKFKEIVTRIKFLVEDDRFRYVLSGSLLGIEITNLTSAPVGYLKMLKMYPLDFEEFLQIFDVPDTVFEAVRRSFKDLIPLDDTIHNRLMSLFNLYMIIGGMPAAVEQYRQSGNIDKVIDEHKEIIELYKLDFTQYEEENKKLIISNIYELIPAEINEANKRFKIADIDKNLRYDRMVDSFTWLWKAGVALPVFNVTQPMQPLLINQKSTLFKLFLSDIGMLTSIYGKAAKLKILQNEKSINKGAVYENVIAQELIAHGYPLYYYNNKKKGELDFVIEEGEEVIPIEVKSGKDYKRHSALRNVMSEKNYQIKKAIVFSGDNVSKSGRILYLPLYMIMAFQKDDIDFADISVERFKWDRE